MKEKKRLTILTIFAEKRSTKHGNYGRYGIH